MSIASVPRMTTKKTVRAWFSADLSKDEKLMKLLETYHKVHIDNTQEYNKMLSWCLEHSQGKFRDIKHGDGLDWYFENEQDASMFAIKWA